MANVTAPRVSAPGLNVAAARATPFWLPASHFVAGLIALLAVAALVIFAAGDLAAGRFLQPRVVALTHLLTLGWLTISIMGALCQLFPVVLGTPLRWVRLSAFTLALYAPGLALFVTGLLTGVFVALVAGATLFSVALILFLVNAAGTLKASAKRDVTWWTLAAAFFFLAATITFGISLAVNLRTGHLGTGRLWALFVHVHVALGGWVMLTITAVARRLLPMFLLSHSSDERALKVAAIAMAGGALLLSLFHRGMPRVLLAAAIVLMATSLAALAVQISAYVRTRHRPQLDAGLRLVMIGGLHVVAALVIGVTAFLGSAPQIAAYGVALVGGLSLFVAGHYYKILPFLLWNHRFAPLAGKKPLPKISDLYDARFANAATTAIALGMVVLLAGTLMHALLLARAGAVMLAAGLVGEVVQLIQLLRTDDRKFS